LWIARIVALLLVRLICLHLSESVCVSSVKNVITQGTGPEIFESNSCLVLNQQSARLQHNDEKYYDNISTG
jgi:hypothetical protein